MDNILKPVRCGFGRTLAQSRRWANRGPESENVMDNPCPKCFGLGYLTIARPVRRYQKIESPPVCTGCNGTGQCKTEKPGNRVETAGNELEGPGNGTHKDQARRRLLGLGR
jgi:hypothetical protein